MRICVFTDHQLFDRFHKYNLKSDKARSGKVALSLKELNQFTPGDYVVHTDHGVGRFAGLVRIPNGDTTQEVMKIVYQNEDVVFVSIHSLHKVSKYKGKEGEAPRLNKLGTGAWEKLKDRTKTKIKDIARDLIKLYSQRREEKGFQYSSDSFLQRELEASFIYEDTPDQSKATSDVKADMESARPMDAWCAVTWASARRRWLFVPLSRLWRTISRWLYWCPLPYLLSAFPDLQGALERLALPGGVSESCPHRCSGKGCSERACRRGSEYSYRYPPYPGKRR